MHFAPPQGEHVEAAVVVRCLSVKQRSFAVPLRKHFGIPRPAFNRHIGEGDMESWKDAAETLELEADRVFVVTLTAERVGARNAMMYIGRESFHRFIPAMIVHVIEGLPDFHPHNGTVNHLSSPILKSRDVAACSGSALPSLTSALHCACIGGSSLQVSDPRLDRLTPF